MPCSWGALKGLRHRLERTARKPGGTQKKKSQILVSSPSTSSRPLGRIPACHSLWSRQPVGFHPGVVERVGQGRMGDRRGAAPTLSWDLETLPLWSRSSAVKACQMALSSSSFKTPMAKILQSRLPQLPRQPLSASDAPWPLPPPPAAQSPDRGRPRPRQAPPSGRPRGIALRSVSSGSGALPIPEPWERLAFFPSPDGKRHYATLQGSQDQIGPFSELACSPTRALTPRKNMSRGKQLPRLQPASRSDKESPGPSPDTESLSEKTRQEPQKPPEKGSNASTASSGRGGRRGSREGPRGKLVH